MMTKMKKKLLVVLTCTLSLGAFAQDINQYNRFQGDCLPGHAEIQDSKTGEKSCEVAGCVARVDGYMFGYVTSKVYLHVGGEIIKDQLKSSYLHKTNGSVRKIEKDLIKLMDEGMCREAWIVNETLEPSSGNKYLRVYRD